MEAVGPCWWQNVPDPLMLPLGESALSCHGFQANFDTWNYLQNIGHCGQIPFWKTYPNSDITNGIFGPTEWSQQEWSILHNPFSHSFTNRLFPPASCYKSCNPTNNHCLIENPIQFRILKFPTEHKELIRPCRCAVDSAKNWWAHIREWHGAGMHWQKHWQMLHRYGHLEMQAWVLCRYI